MRQSGNLGTDKPDSPHLFVKNITGRVYVAGAKARRLLKDINAVDILFKPFDGDRLLDAVERAIGSSLSAV